MAAPKLVTQKKKKVFRINPLILFYFLSVSLTVFVVYNSIVLSGRSESNETENASDILDKKKSTFTPNLSKNNGVSHGIHEAASRDYELPPGFKAVLDRAKKLPAALQ